MFALALKIAHDLDDEAIRSIADVARRDRHGRRHRDKHTVARADVESYAKRNAGGPDSSGAPLRERLHPGDKYSFAGK